MEIILYGMWCAFCGYVFAKMQFNRRLKSRTITAQELGDLIKASRAEIERLQKLDKNAKS